METIAEIVEKKALASVKAQADSKAREALCFDCLDKRCLSEGRRCNAFRALSESYAWEIVARCAELN